VRNRLRRRLRELARHMELPPGTYLIRANPAAPALSFQELSTHLSRAVTVLTTGGTTASQAKPAPEKPVTSDWERPTLERP
jgi:RNase P protein component